MKIEHKSVSISASQMAIKITVELNDGNHYLFGGVAYRGQGTVIVHNYYRGTFNVTYPLVCQQTPKTGVYIRTNDGLPVWSDPKTARHNEKSFREKFSKELVAAFLAAWNPLEAKAMQAAAKDAKKKKAA